MQIHSPPFNICACAVVVCEDNTIQKSPCGQTTPTFEMESLLASATSELADSILGAVEKVECSFKESTDILYLLRIKNPDGVINLAAIMPAYVQAMKKVGVKTKQELESLWENRSGDSSVSGNVKRLREVEEKYATLVLEIQERLTVVEDAAVGDNNLEVGSYFPKGLLLTDVPTEESVELGSAWSNSPFTLFVLMRHYR